MVTMNRKFLRSANKKLYVFAGDTGWTQQRWIPFLRLLHSRFWSSVASHYYFQEKKKKKENKRRKNKWVWTVSMGIEKSRFFVVVSSVAACHGSLILGWQIPWLTSIGSIEILEVPQLDQTNLREKQSVYSYVRWKRALSTRSTWTWTWTYVEGKDARREGKRRMFKRRKRSDTR